MNKNIKNVILLNLPLLLWFILDMTGFSIGDNVLVSQAYKEDGIFLIIYLISLMSFVYLKGKCKLILPAWLSIWFISQLYFHWYFTIFGSWEGKNKFFEDTIKLIPQSERYLPDLYHIVLHIFILIALISTLIYMKKDKK